ncbi:MAG: hypothetical protein EBS47_11375 [Betaproteobacteria bacterium]|nr:hypothetical protein [Betaproteobacteria bacterium]
MIQSLDPVGPGQRLEPIYLEGRGPLIDAEQARVLGLRNGQVVQAVIDNAGSAFSVLWPAGQRGGLPTALEAFPLPSQWRWAAGSMQELVALLMPGGFIQLRPVKTGPPAPPTASAGRPGPSASGAAPAPAAPAAASGGVSGATIAGGAAGLASVPASTGLQAGQAPGAYTLGQAFALAQGLLPGAAAAGPGGAVGLPTGASAELARLMQQAPAWAALLNWLRALTQPESEDGPPAPTDPLPTPTVRLMDLLGGALPRMGNLTPTALQQAMARSGMGTEAALLAGAVGLDQDLKVALRRLQRSLPSGLGGVEAHLARSVDTLERSQLDALTAQMQGQVLLSMVIPFGDAGPVALRLFRERARRDEEPPPFVVDVHSGHSGLGPLWLRTQVAHDRRVAMTMWALRPEVAQQAREQSRALRLNLSQSGLVLASLDIVTGAPEVDEVAFADPGRSA